MFDRQLAGPSERYRVLALDFRGHGRSDKAAHGHRISRLSKDVEEWMTALDLRDVTLLGWSMGAITLACLPWVLLDARTGLEPPARVPVRWLWLAMLLAVDEIMGMFQEGIELRTYMTHAVCTPSRAGLLTGKHYARLDQGPKTGGTLRNDGQNLAKDLQAAGYATACLTNNVATDHHSPERVSCGIAPRPLQTTA